MVKVLLALIAILAHAGIPDDRLQLSDFKPSVYSYTGGTLNLVQRNSYGGVQAYGLEDTSGGNIINRSAGLTLISYAAGNAAFLLEDYLIEDNNGYHVIDWGNDVLNDGTAGVASIDWKNRLLKNSSGSTIASWSSSPFTVTGTFSATGTGEFNANGAASTPALQATGTPYSGGTATTTKPLVSFETSGATSTAWNTGGTILGVNGASAFAGRLIDVQENGVTGFSVDNGNGSVNPGVFIRNLQDNANGGLNICGRSGNVSSSANCSSLYQGNGTTFTWYSLDAAGGSFAIWSAQMAWATTVIGNGSYTQAFSGSTQPTLLVVNQNWSNANTSPTIGLMPKSSQTAPILQTYQPYSTSTAPFSITAAGYPAVTPQGSGITPTCGSSQNGEIAMTSAGILCSCISSAWVNSGTGLSCTF